MSHDTCSGRASHVVNFIVSFVSADFLAHQPQIFKSNPGLNRCVFKREIVTEALDSEVTLRARATSLLTTNSNQP
jgi:hypothetical protein